MPPRKARGGGGRRSGPSRTTTITTTTSKKREKPQTAAVVPRATQVTETEPVSNERSATHRKRKLEQPASLEQHVRFFALTQSRRTGAYDDTQPRRKRRRVDPSEEHDRDKMEQPIQMPSYGCGLPLPPRQQQQQQQQQQTSHDPVTSMGLLGKLPTETRDAIFRHVLLWPGDVRVLQGWSLAFPRTRPRLPGIALLATCKVLQQQGARLLYGENRFVHLVRDPPMADESTTRRVLRGIYGCVRRPGERGGLNIPIHRYGHLIRHVAIVVEANRMADRDHRDNFLRSIAKLGPKGGLPFPANLHTVTIQVPALAGKDLHGGDAGAGVDMNNDRLVPICSFFDVRAIEALKRLNTSFIRILATDRCGRLLESVIDLRYESTKQRHARSITGNRNKGEEDPATRDQVLMSAREERARRAIARLENMSYNLQTLALYPQNAMQPQWNMWTVVDKSVAASVSLVVEDNIGLGEDFQTPERESVERETPTLSPPSRPMSKGRRQRETRGQLTEKWLEGLEPTGHGNGIGIGERSSSSQPRKRQRFQNADAGSLPPNRVKDLEAKLNRMKVARVDDDDNTQAPPPKTTNTTAATSARKGKITIKLPTKPKKPATAATTAAPKKQRQQQHAKKNSKATRPSRETEAQIIATERDIARIDKKAAPAVALIRAERIAKEKAQAAREAAAAARAATDKHGEGIGGGGGENARATATAPGCSASGSS